MCVGGNRRWVPLNFNYMNSIESTGNKLKINRNKDRGHFLKI